MAPVVAVVAADLAAEASAAVVAVDLAAEAAAADLAAADKLRVRCGPGRCRLAVQCGKRYPLHAGSEKPCAVQM
ncbi:MAG: hypothetical protein LUH06_00460 [Oscillospiraceae bacterium]|nr:hypothetical protein [Oscillospiraceae bacterium]